MRRPLVAIAAVAFALAGIYSLAAPWLAQRNLPATIARTGEARALVRPALGDALTDWAAYEDAAGNTARAAELYREAVALEPENAQTWYELGSFYFDYKAWALAYAALNNSYTYDRFGPASKTCGLLDQARTKATASRRRACSRVPRITTVFEPLSAAGRSPSTGATRRMPVSRASRRASFTQPGT